jgi:hypothetical protein
MNLESVKWPTWTQASGGLPLKIFAGLHAHLCGSYPDLVAYDSGIDAGRASAEEAAVHVVDGPDEQ